MCKQEALAIWVTSHDDTLDHVELARPRVTFSLTITQQTKKRTDSNGRDKRSPEAADENQPQAEDAVVDIAAAATAQGCLQARWRRPPPSQTPRQPLFLPYVDDLNLTGDGLEWCCGDLAAFQLHEQEEATFP